MFHLETGAVIVPEIETCPIGRAPCPVAVEGGIDDGFAYDRPEDIVDQGFPKAAAVADVMIDSVFIYPLPRYVSFVDSSSPLHGLEFTLDCFGMPVGHRVILYLQSASEILGAVSEWVDLSGSQLRTDSW